jgi:hypothetical protein
MSNMAILASTKGSMDDQWATASQFAIEAFLLHRISCVL